MIFLKKMINASVRYLTNILETAKHNYSCGKDATSVNFEKENVISSLEKQILSSKVKLLKIILQIQESFG